MLSFLLGFKSARYRPTAQSGDAFPQGVSALQKNVSMPAGVVSMFSLKMVTIMLVCDVHQYC